MVDILNLEWTSSPSRDREAATLVCNYLRLRGYSVHEGCVFNGYSLIDSLKPSLLFITNSVGAGVNLSLIKYAKMKGIHCVTSFAEGNFKEESIEQFLWGVNKEKKLYEDLTLFWNENSYKYSISSHPEIKEKVGVAGCVGFDRYKLIESEKDKNEKFTVLVSCWNFDFIDPTNSIVYGLFNGKKIASEYLDFFKSDREKFNKELLNLINALPDVNFVIKMHPGCLGGQYYSGIQGVEAFDNVTLLKNEVAISELIRTCNILLSYESTTALEAWLMDKTTLLLNPSGTEFIMREGFHQGQPAYTNSDELVEVITSYRESGCLKAFDVLCSKRKALIEEIACWSDGLNHVRLGLYIEQQIKSDPYREHYTFGEMYELYLFSLKSRVKWVLSKLFFKFKGKPLFSTHDWDEEEAAELSRLRIKEQVKFYNSVGLDVKEKDTCIRAKIL